MLKYLKYQKACDIAFGIFMLLWVASRHIVYPLLVYSVYRDLPIYIQLGCYKGSNTNIEGPFPIPDGLGYLIAPFIDPEGLICQTEATQTIWLSLLIFLQAILLLWFSMIVRVAIKVLRSQEADDPRSDGEDEEEEEMEELQMKDVRLKHDIYIEVPTTEAGNSVAGPQRSNGKSSPSHKVRRGHGNATGVSLPHDRKELLGRIGCDKGN
jgi:acyl-CoA-dependent ceramide synthase